MPLSPERTGLFRAGAARAKYLALDRPDIAFAAKELCRRMSAPCAGNWAAPRSVARYQLGAPREVYCFRMQPPADLDVYADTDRAGCTSTPPAHFRVGARCATRILINHWSGVQTVVTLSSDEAELAGVVQGASDGARTAEPRLLT